MQQFKELIERQYQANLPFVLYHKPQEVEVNLMTQTDKELFYLNDTVNESGFIFAPFDASKKAIIFPHKQTNSFSFPHQMFLDKQPASTGFKYKEDARQAEIYQELVNKAIASIEQTELKKIVTSRVLELPVEVPQVSELFHRLTATYPDAMTYVWYHPKVGLWAGASPETLLKVKHQNLETVALAGTRHESDLPAQPFTSKEYEEQDLVTQHILDNLKPYVKTLHQSERSESKAGQLIHLKTTIKARLKSQSLQQVIAQLHPTPAVCGLPTQLAKQFLEQNETYNRQFYSGYFGELNFKSENKRSNRPQNIENQVFKSLKTSSNLFVNLRCMSFQDATCYIYVGGGITGKSNALAEWQETCNKAQTMLNVL